MVRGSQVEERKNMSVMERMPKSNGKQDGITRLFSKTSQAEKWLDNRIRRGKVEKFAEIIELTPELAAVLLERNPENRPVSATKIHEYCQDVENGRWKGNGESIIVSRCGLLNDGQHRCVTVTTTGHPMPDVLITFGWPRETRDTIDTGMAKTVGHHLGMEGYKDGNNLATAARFVWQYENTGTMTRGGKEVRPSKAAIKEWAERHPGLIDSLRLIPSKTNGILTRPKLAFCHYIFVHKDREDADEFISCLINGEGLTKGDPILVARNRLIADKAAGKTRDQEQIEIVFRAWNFFRMGEHIRRINTSGRLPVVK